MTQDFIQDLVEQCEEEGVIYVVAVARPGDPSVLVYDNTRRSGDPRNGNGESTGEVFASAIAGALTKHDDEQRKRDSG